MNQTDVLRAETGRMLDDNGVAHNVIDPTSGFVEKIDFLTQIARGKISEMEPISAYGQYVATGGEVNHLIWPDGVFNIPASSGVQMSIVSTSASDDNTPGGTGIRTIDIHYLDANLNPMIEAVALNGTTPVLTMATNIRFIQCVHILTAGSAKAAVGTINVTNSGIIYSQIAAGGRRCSSTARMVPKGKKCYVQGAAAGSVSGTAAAGALLKISSTWFTDQDLTSQLIFVPFGSIGMQDTSVPYSFPLPAGPFPEGTIIAMEVSVDKASTITGNWFGWLENA